MIVFGSRMYFKKNVVRSFAECEHCGVYGKHTSYQSRKFGHVYFIPLIPLGGKSQVLRECRKCKMGAHIDIATLDATVDSLADRLKSWISAIAEGESQLVLQEGAEPVSIGVLVAGVLDDLYCLNEIESIDSIVSILDSNNMQYEKEIVVGRWSEIQGDLEQARLSYQAASRVRKEDPVPLYQLATVEAKLNNLPGAVAAYEQYFKVAPDDISAYGELADLYQSDKNFDKVVETYDILYGLNPDLIANKSLKKIYKKACKKSGKQGKYLAQM